MISIFVYGTLRKGGLYHHMIRDHVISCEKIRLSGLRMYDDGRGYPLLVRSNEEDYVIGELFQLHDPHGRLLTALDELEGASEETSFGERLYRRELVEVKTGLTAWVYIYNHPLGPEARLIRDWMGES